MTLPRFAQTSTFRLALVYAAIFTVSSLLLFGTLYLRVTNYAFDQMRTSIAAELESIVEEGRLEGPQAILREVSERSQRAESSSSYYLLQSGAGERLAGNIQPVRTEPGDRELKVIPVNPKRDRQPVGVPALLRAVALPSGDILAIGRDLADLRDLNHLITRWFLLAILGCAAVGLAGGVVMGFGMVRRIEAIASTSQRIISGNLSERIPVRGSGDELDRLATTLNEMLERIEILMETTRQVSNDIAHDLRTPLSRLRRRLEAVVNSHDRIDVLKEEVSDAIAELDEILSTFSALLRIAEIEVHSRRLGFGKVDLSALVQVLAETYAPVAEDSGNTLSCEVAENVFAWGDTDLLTQLLSNLIENAIRHCPQGTKISIVLDERGGQPVVVVADDGPGIPVDERDKVFRRFYRLERSRTTPGSGLGLALASAVAEVHGARLSLEDNRPGTRFVLMFPALGDSPEG
ncbi:ATP-binding protein [Alsobacter sp. R-9]